MAESRDKRHEDDHRDILVGDASVEEISHKTREILFFEILETRRMVQRVWKSNKENRQQFPEVRSLLGMRQKILLDNH